MPESAKEPAHDPIPPPPSFRDRDIRDFAWWLIGQSLRGDIDDRRVSVMATMIRVLASLGPAPMDDQEELAAIRLRGRLMHGIPPADGDWPALEELFDADAVAEIRRWSALFDGDVFDGDQPLILGDMVTGHGDVPVGIHDEDRVGGDRVDGVADGAALEASRGSSSDRRDG